LIIFRINRSFATWIPVDKQIDELTAKIGTGITGLSLEEFKDQQRPIWEVTTTSIDAYNYYVLADDAQNKFYWDEAREFLEKAVAIDSTFAMAYIDLSLMYRNLGLEQKRWEPLEKAKKYAYKATEKERLIIEAFYCITGN